MSKEKLEVGDIWEIDENDLIKIIETNERFSICLIKDSEGYHIHPILNPFFMQYGKLLGRNSITLDDLFKTENEE